MREKAYLFRFSAVRFNVFNTPLFLKCFTSKRYCLETVSKTIPSLSPLRYISASLFVSIQYLIDIFRERREAEREGNWASASQDLFTAEQVTELWEPEYMQD